MKPVIVTAQIILKLLLRKHSDDVCVPECKNGQSFVKEGTMKKFDLWTMKRSYSKPMVCIYEIKVNRQDFLRDDKWQTYLPYCNNFYFVALAGIIDPAEVPADSGLLLSSKNGTRLFCKKKAPHRTDVEIPKSLFEYIVMTRAKIVKSTYTDTDNCKDMQAFWRRWLEEKNVKQKLGRDVSRRIRELYTENVARVEAKQNHLELQIEKLEEIKEIVEKMGFDANNLGWTYKQDVKDRIDEINEGFPEKDILLHLEKAVSSLRNTIEIIKDSGAR